MSATGGTARWSRRLQVALRTYFSVGLACALWYVVIKRPEAAGDPLSWVTIVGLLVAWPVTVALLVWFLW